MFLCDVWSADGDGGKLLGGGGGRGKKKQLFTELITWSCEVWLSTWLLRVHPGYFPVAVREVSLHSSPPRWPSG